MKYTLKKYFTFTPEEFRRLIITIIVLGFIIGFDDGRPKFELGQWLLNFLNVTLIVALAMLVHLATQRFYALKVGYMAEYRSWAIGLIISLILVFVSAGSWIVLIPGGIVLHQLAGLRLGHFRYGLNYFTMGWIVASGAIANIVLAIFFKAMLIFPLNPVLIEKAILINVLIAIFSMLPIPPLDGMSVFYASRILYMILIGAIVGAGILLMLPAVSIGIAILGSLGIGLLVLGFYWLTFEKPV